MTFVLGAKAESFAAQPQALSRGQVVYVEKQGEGTAEAVLFSWLPLTIEEK